MHVESIAGMEKFVTEFMVPDKVSDILDVGSCDINGSYKELYCNHRYTGIDVSEGKNVDYVMQEPYNWIFDDDSFDVVISGQALEHIEYPWLTIKEMYRVLRKGGRSCIIVPQDAFEHRCPLDCYRYFPDGLRALAKWAGFRTIEVFRTTDTKYTDCMWIGEK